jgi:hypothetical protein
MHGDKCKSIYVHWDGYLSGVGKTLLGHYDSAKANHLVALGDVSSLGRNVEIPEGIEHSFERPAEGITTFYGRDRGDTGSEFWVDHTFAEFMETVANCGAEFYYIMKDGVWYCGENGELVELSKTLAWEALQAFTPSGKVRIRWGESN